jgi:lipoprotein-releasing system ATP-binding protein
MNNVVISASSVAKVYDEGPKTVTAVDGVSLGIARGELVTVVGPSGAGKSTLLHLLGGLDRPTSGRVFIDGEDIYALADSARSRIRNRKIGFIFQFYHLLPEFTALENVMMPALMKKRGVRGLPAGRQGKGLGIRGKAEDILRSVGLEGRMGHRPGELSGGESQRVAIARALINDPIVLLCDEPTGNLDSRNSDTICRLLADLRSSSGISIVIVTHDEGISSMSDRTIRLKDGRIA